MYFRLQHLIIVRLLVCIYIDVVYVICLLNLFDTLLGCWEGLRVVWLGAPDSLLWGAWDVHVFSSLAVRLLALRIRLPVAA